MKAHELMTTSVISVAPDAPLRGVAQMLLDHGISAVPVVDAGMPVGVVSEGDIVSRCCEQSRPRRDWFARLFAGGAELDELMIFQRSMQVARDVMSAPVITTVESVEAEELSRIMITHGVKRLPVVRAGRMVGIVSRADLLRAVAARGGATSAHREHEHSALTDFFLGIDHVFHRNHAPQVDGGEHGEHGGLAAHGVDPSSGDTEHVFTAAALRATVEHHKEEEARFRAQARAVRHAQSLRDVGMILNTHLTEDVWRHMLLDARHAAERGEREIQLLRMPHEACTDNGRLINIGAEGWPGTLRGEAAELWLRWQSELKPRGFRLVARTLEYPDGLPGDIGLFLVWGSG